MGGFFSKAKCYLDPEELVAKQLKDRINWINRGVERREVGIRVSDTKYTNELFPPYYEMCCPLLKSLYVPKEIKYRNYRSLEYYMKIKYILKTELNNKPSAKYSDKELESGLY